MRRVICLFVALILFFSNVIFIEPLSASDSENEIWQFYSVITRGSIRAYQKLISPISISSCPMHPTCSGYALQSFKKSNPIFAVLKTGDRLIRCQNDLENYQKKVIDGYTRYYDPVVPISENVNAKKISQQKVLLDLEKIEEKEKIKFEEKALYEFARELEQKGNLDAALLEYYRFRSYFSESPYIPNVLKSILNVLFQQDRYLDVIQLGQEIFDYGNEEIVNIGELKFLIGLAYLNIDNTRMARIYFDKAMDNKESLEKVKLFKGFSFAKDQAWEKAIETFSTIETQSEYFNIAEDSINLSRQGKKLKFKDPVLAAALGVFPGLGYLYTGHRMTALSSFLVNSLLAFGAKKAFQNDNYALGTLVGVFGIALYAGNIYGSYRTAESINENIRRNHLIEFGFSF